MASDNDSGGVGLLGVELTGPEPKQAQGAVRLGRKFERSR